MCLQRNLNRASTRLRDDACERKGDQVFCRNPRRLFRKGRNGAKKWLRYHHEIAASPGEFN